jgi:hypothetical protein
MALGRWKALTRYARGGRLAIDDGAVEIVPRARSRWLRWETIGGRGPGEIGDRICNALRVRTLYEVFGATKLSHINCSRLFGWRHHFYRHAVSVAKGGYL